MGGAAQPQQSYRHLLVKLYETRPPVSGGRETVELGSESTHPLAPIRRGISSTPHDAPEGFQNLGSCCGSVVLVNESTDYIAAVDLVAGSWCDCGGRLGWEQRESAMRAFAVVMDRVGEEDAFEVTAAEDQQPVETLAADGADEALRVGVGLWRAECG